LAGPKSERRLVSVLFADLVGFTALSEQRDPEEVRDLLGRYFESAQQVVGRYGGSIEKFIGDAVMAVWGTPTAQGDDAERAVRAAIDLTQAVVALGVDVGAEDLRARAGVTTGEAAVTLGAEGQGMVAGDLVNTASRIQAAADPGTVLVGDATRRATEAAIAYDDVGEHDLKGKTEPVHLWRATRVVAARGGALRSTGLESPFVGRDRELRMVKELYHSSAEEHRSHLLSVVGIAGIGKSRLSWEVFKYLDGLAGTVFWHRGRCLAYGEGVAYWALAEMVRMRAGIAEGEADEGASAKLHAAVELYVPDPDERGWIEPRLAYLLGLEQSVARQREDLFGAWRLFFERLAEQEPVVLVFEDLQWADAALLDFIDYLLEWSRTHRLFVMTLARPEFADRRSDWGAGRRSFTSLYLDPLDESAMRSLLDALIPGLPEELADRILERAAGVPLYAVETIRMLLDRGLLQPEGTAYGLTGPVDALDIPETLHALIAARLDGLSPDEGRVVRDAAVLGKTKPASRAAPARWLGERAWGPGHRSLRAGHGDARRGRPDARGRGSFGQDGRGPLAQRTGGPGSRTDGSLLRGPLRRRARPGSGHVVAQLARFHYFSGNLELARERVDFALRIAEDRVLPEVLSQALNTKNLVLLSESRYEEGLALLKHALDVAVEGDLTAAAGRALHNLGDAMMSANRYGEALEYDARSLEQARRLGSRMDEWMSLVHLVGSHTALGEWDEALALVGQGPDPADGTDAEVFAALMSCWALDVFLARGTSRRPAHASTSSKGPATRTTRRMSRTPRSGGRGSPARRATTGEP